MKRTSDDSQSHGMLLLNTCLIMIYVIMLSYLQVAKRYFCTYAPWLDISLKKIPRPSNLHTTYLSRYSMRWYLQIKYFPKGSIFFRVYNLVNTPFFLEICKFEKILPIGTRLDISLKNYHDLQICTRPTCRGILCDHIYQQNIFQPEVFFSNLQTSKKNGVFRRL